LKVVGKNSLGLGAKDVEVAAADQNREVPMNIRCLMTFLGPLALILHAATAPAQGTITGLRLNPPTVVACALKAITVTGTGRCGGFTQPADLLDQSARPTPTERSALERQAHDLLAPAGDSGAKRYLRPE